MLENWINPLIRTEGANLYRNKGIINVKGMDQKFIFQGVGIIFYRGFDNTTWKAREKRENRFVFIGKNLDPEFYKTGFLVCREDKPLRFPVGTKVMANIADFTPAIVLKHWD